MGKAAFSGGSLSFKGDAKKKSKKSKKKSKESKQKLKLKREEEKRSSNGDAVETYNDGDDDGDDDMTDAERKAMERRKARQTEENTKLAKQSHRDRIETLNAKLGSMTELNDIPRVSAAGNG